MIKLVRTREPNKRVSECGRVTLTLVKEYEKRVFKWAFDFPPFMGAKFDFVAYNRPSAHPWYDKKARTKSRLRARALFDALDDGIDAEVGLLRKPKYKPWRAPRIVKPRPHAGASACQLRDVLQTRFGVEGATAICSTIHPDVAYPNLNADMLFECLYAERWATSYGRSLSEWGGMITSEAENAPRLGVS